MKLSKIKKEMNLLKENGDIETRHAIADGLLIETIKTLSRNPVKNNYQESQVTAIINGFNKLNKWYA
jgi:hypothetical protein